MGEPRFTRRRGRAKLNLVVAGTTLCFAGAVYALLSSEGATERPTDEQASAAKSAPRFFLRVKPRSRSVVPGAVAKFKIRIRPSDSRRVRLRVLDGAPPGAAVSLSRRSTRRSKATLTISTAAARRGSYTIRLRARRGKRRATSAVNLVIGSPQPSGFTISGDLRGPLEPGLGAAVDLSLGNPSSAPIAISGLGVGVQSVLAPQADAAHPCTTADFSVTQFSGALGFTLGSTSSSTLGELGFSEAQWPRVTMLDRPVNQNGCKGASLTLSYSGTSIGSDQ